MGTHDHICFSKIRDVTLQTSGADFRLCVLVPKGLQRSTKSPTTRNKQERCPRRLLDQGEVTLRQLQRWLVETLRVLFDCGFDRTNDVDVMAIVELSN